MTAADGMAEDEQFGPLEVLVVEFPDGTVRGDGFDRLLALADAGLIQVLDLEFVERGGDGVTAVDPADLRVGDGVDLSPFAGAASGLLDADDRALLIGTLGADSVAAILVYEQLTMEPVVAAWRAAGATIALAGHVEPEDLEDSLDATE